MGEFFATEARLTQRHCDCGTTLSSLWRVAYKISGRQDRAGVVNIVFFQYGQYAQAYRNALSGQAETYRDQFASVAYVAALAPEHSVTTVCICDDPHDELLAPGLRSIGIAFDLLDDTKTGSILAELAPDCLILRTPHMGALRYAHAHAIPTLPCFADIFSLRSGLRGLKDRLTHRSMRKMLSGAHVPCVSNHSLNASRSMIATLGLDEARVVPWDWSRVPVLPDLKSSAQDNPSAFYAGMLLEDKGVGDCLEAAALLKRQGLTVSLSFAGGGTEDGSIDDWRARAEAMGLSEQVTFLGLIPNTQVRSEMAAHDMVLVPSRHGYAEGLPNTIYEGLAARSPLILSDHPAFSGRLVPGTDCLSFKAADPADLARAIASLSTDPALYARLSQNADAALDRLYIGLEWEELVDLFLADPANKTGWVAPNALAALT